MLLPVLQRRLNTRRGLIPLVLGMALCAPVFSADFDTTLAAYEQQKYAEALTGFRQTAKLGHARSQFNLGVMYYKGQGVPADSVEAVVWLSLAADNGDEQATKYVEKLRAKLNAEQRGEFETRLKSARDTYGSEAVRKRWLPVFVNECVAGESKLVRVKSVAPVYPRQAGLKAMNGTVEIRIRVNEQGLVQEADVVRAIPAGVFEKAALKAVRQWQYKWLATPSPNVWRFTTIDFKIVEVDALKLNGADKIRAIAAQAREGVPYAQYLLAQYLVLSVVRESIPELHDEQSIFWLTKAAQAGVVEAQYFLGRSLTQGADCHYDYDKGMNWLKLAADQGNADAQYEYAQYVLISDTSESRRKKAWEWLNASAAQNYIPAARDLAWWLAVAPDAALRDGKRAQQLAELLKAKHENEPRSWEVIAAAAAEAGDFAQAVKAQKEALELAEDEDWHLPVMSERLAAYQANKPWREPLPRPPARTLR